MKQEKGDTLCVQCKKNAPEVDHARGDLFCETCDPWKDITDQIQGIQGAKCSQCKEPLRVESRDHLWVARCVNCKHIIPGSCGCGGMHEEKSEPS